MTDRALSGIEFARYGRQILLREVGRAGQLEVLGAVAHVGGDTLANRVAETFARRAGFAEVSSGEVGVEQLAPRHLVVVPAARAVLAGARAALQRFREVAVGSGSGEPMR